MGVVPVPRYEPFADRIVREAIERGEFDNLPGKGKPLHLKRVGDPDWWIKDKLSCAGSGEIAGTAENS